MKQALGIFVMGLPWIITFGLIVASDGWLAACEIFGATLGVLAFSTVCVVAGVKLIESEK